jgi:hypothetical protein
MNLSIKMLAEWFKHFLNKWRLAFLAFAIVYGFFLVFGVNEIFGLAHMAIRWDEVANLSGGLLLLRGSFHQFMSLNTFYPPLYATFTAIFFAFGGVSVFMGRFVSVAFSLLALYTVFECTYRMCSAKIALLACALLAIMPGYVWLSRIAMIETALLLFFLVSTFSFFFWLKEHKTKFLGLSGLAFALGLLTKYQTVIVLAIAVAGLAFLGREYLVRKFRTFRGLAIMVFALAVPLVLLFYFVYSSGMLNQWLYALEIGNPDKTLYSTGLNRFPTWFDSLPNWIQTPVFYLIELTAQYPSVHPISFLLYATGLVGLGWLAWRRKAEDKYLLIWFVIVYVFFTLIPNKEWRYLIPIFPVLAISGAILIVSALSTAQKTWKLPQVGIRKKRFVQVAAGTLIAFTLIGFFFSASDAYDMSRDQTYMPLEDATNYVGSNLKSGENVMVLCAFNLMDERIVWFYLNEKKSFDTLVFQYPTEPVDTYTPDFNVTELVAECESNNIKYLLVDEYGGASYHYFGTILSFVDFNQTLMSTKRFTYEPVSYWKTPARIFVLTFS